MSLLTIAFCTSQANAQVPRIILDADMSSDHDDIGAIATLHALADLGECQIIGMMVSSLNGATPLCMDAINTYYGRPNIPIGVRPDIGGIGGYPGTIAAEFPHDLTSASACPTAVNLYRQLLAASPDNSVVIVTVGYLTNVKALLQSGPDANSPLSGPALIAQKVKLLSAMGGVYPSGNEFNFTASSDDSAFVVVNNWPTAARYSGFEIGNPIATGGNLVSGTPATNPIRRVYELKGGGAHASWDQTAVYSAVRINEGVWNTNNVGKNTTTSSGSNAWVASPDPTGSLDQSYLLEKSRTPLQDGIDTLMMAAPNNGTASKPSKPTYLRATVVSGTQVNLQWTDNAYNETGFKIERRNSGVYTQIGTVGANVTTFSDTAAPFTANSSYRVRANNSTGDSDYTTTWVYSGWTETNFAGSGTTPPLYNYYQTNSLSWARGGDFRPDHVTVNNDSMHGQTVNINVDVAAQGSQGNFYVYFFYQDANNWYRFSFADTGVVKFEKRLSGTITQIGTTATVTNIGSGPLINWRIEVTPAGTFKFIQAGTTVLSVAEALSLSSGKIGLGGNARTPIWENFNFDGATAGGSAPAAPTSLTSTAGNAQVVLNWTASSGATSYNVYRGTAAGGESVTPIVTGLTSPTYTNTGLTNGTAYYYKVSAVNSFGTSAYSNEANATPTAGGSAPAAPTSLAATAGNTQVVLGWTASSGATSYNVYRGSTAGGESTTAIATGVTGTGYTNTGLVNGTAYFYKVAAVNSFGTSAYSNEASATPAAGGGGSGTFANAGFEAPSVGGYTYSSTGSSWTFVNNAGIQHNGSAYGASAAPEGLQTGFVQGISSTLGSMSQSVNFSTAGSYTLSFQAAQRFGQVQPVLVTVDGATVGTYTPSSNSFALITTASFTVTAGNHTIAFAATNNTADKSSFIDAVSIAGGSGGSAPAAPTGLSATAGNALVNLSWTASSGATSYNVYRGTTAGGESTTPVVTGLTGTTYSNTGLSNGTAYYYKVAAVNTTGTSAYSNEANATPTSGGSAPAAPTALTATSGDSQIALNWTASSGATSYNVYRGTAAGGESTTPIVTGVTGTSYTNTALANGTAYYYKVAAVNSFGTSAYSNEANATPATSGGGGTATFANASFETPSTGSYIYTSAGSSWTFVNNGGIQHNGSAYGATAAPDGVQTGLVQGISGTLGSMSQSVNFSTAGSYTISFQAARRSGQVQPILVSVDGTAVGTYTPASNSFASITTASFTVSAGNHTVVFAATDNTADKTSFIDVVSIAGGSGGGGAPAAPTGLSASGGNAQVVLNWTASSGATSYNIYRGTSAGGESVTPIATGITSATYTNTGLSNGTAYYYKVAAVNASGTSAYSNEASATPSSGPNPPAGLTATAGNAQVVLAWTASSGAASYNVYRGTSAGGESTTPIITGLTTTGYTNTGLSNGTAYYYKVAAVNASGTSGYSNEASASPTAGGGGSATFANASFEAPSIGGYTTSSTGTSWTFTNSAGIQHNGSAYSGTSAIAPDGTQTAFIQGNGSISSMAQAVNFPAAGTYTISFQAAQRYSTVQPIQVKVDGTVVGTYTPASASFALITTASFTVTSGSHTITFTATDSTGDKSTFVDVVSIQ